MPIPDPGFWNDLGRLIVEDESAPNHYLVPRRKAIPKKWDAVAGRNQSVTHFFHDQPMGAHGLHNWWYRAGWCRPGGHYQWRADAQGASHGWPADA